MATQPGADATFSGQIPELYETYLVPLIFQPYADDLAARLAVRSPGRVLEVAAGTGVVTRAMASDLPAGSAIVATDLNQAMLDRAATIPIARPVEWRQADAQQLPFPDGTFDAVACQFGAMFFPDRPKAFADARRVLRPGGVLLFNVWDRLEANEFAYAVTQAVESVLTADPPQFLRRTPYGYFDPEAIRRDLAAAGFAASARIDTLAARSRAASPRVPGVAFCEGTPLRSEIESRAPTMLAEVTRAAEQVIARRFGAGAVDGAIQALVVTVEK
jgi:SAM-dependent methyltransferase